MAWSNCFWYGPRGHGRCGGSSGSASATKSLRVLQLGLRWTMAAGYRLRGDGGGRRWIGRYGVEDGGGWGFAAGGEGILVPRIMNGEMEGGGELRGNNVSVWDALV